jgi:anthranilate synthase component I
MYFLIADELAGFDRVAQTITILVNAVLDGRSAGGGLRGRGGRKLSAWFRAAGTTIGTRPGGCSARDAGNSVCSSNMPKEVFMANVERAKKYITAGDIIQVVGSQRFSTPVKAAPLDHLPRGPLHQSVALHVFAGVGGICPGGRLAGNPCALRGPAGGNPAHRRHAAARQTPEEDAALEKELLADPKERAEHVMLVDLARNDLGRVCDFGSVQVKDLMIIERYSHVMHIVSQVEGKLAAGRTPYDLMRATFPPAR